MKRIAFLGAGRMAGAIVDGLLRSGAAKPADLICIGGAGKTAATLAARTGIALAEDLPQLLSGADTFVLACKPQQLASLDPRLADLTRGQLVISVLAGKRTATLSRYFPSVRALVRTMPNTPGQIGAGVTGWCSQHPLPASDRVQVTAILDALGKSIEVPEEQIDALTAVSGSGPAYVFEFAAALRDAGETAGLSRADAHVLAIETLLGAAKLLSQSPLSPEELRNQVTSPNGTTFAGLKVLEGANFRQTMKEVVAAAQRRSIELSQDA